MSYNRYDRDGYSSSSRSGRRGYSSRRRDRKRQERQFELATMLMIIVLMAIGLLAPTLLTPTTVCWAGGAIFLGSAVYQAQRRWRVNPMVWLGGALMIGVALMRANGYGVQFGMLLPIGVFAVVIVASFLTGEL